MTDTLYWVFSTLPQVIAALTGLLVAGTTFVFNGLEKERQKDESLYGIIGSVESVIHRRAMRLLAVSIAAIAADLAVIFLTPHVAAEIEAFPYISESSKWAITVGGAVTSALNAAAFIALYRLLRKILDPKFQEETVKRLSEEVNKATERERDTVDAMTFFQNFREFEGLARRIVPRQPGMPPMGIRQIVNRLIHDHIIPDNERGNIYEMISIRNLIAHEGDIQRVPAKLNATLASLRDRLADEVADIAENQTK